MPSNWGGKKVADLDVLGHSRVAAITRLGQGTVAGPDTVLQDGDVLHVVVNGDSIEMFDSHLSGAPTGGSH